jgi:Transposase DDE domain
MRQGPVALRERGRLAALVSTVVHHARRQAGWREPDRRTIRTWRQFVLGVVVARSTRLVAVGQAVLGQRAARSVKAVALALGYFLSVAKFPAQAVSTQVLEAAVRQLDPAQVATYRGNVVVALDPTEYPKRSRAQSKRGRHMEHVGRVRKPTKGGGRKRRAPHPRPRRAAPPGAAPAPRDTGPPTAARVATTAGYVDVWAGLVLTGKQLLPLARALFSNRHPTLLSQNKVEEAVLDAAVALLERLGWAAILVADRGFGRKELLVALATRRAPPQDFVIRVDADVTVFTAALPAGALLGPVLAAQPVVGEVVWDRGQEGPLRCAARTVTAAIRFSRTGRRDDSTAATLHFVELLPLDGVTDPLVLATTLPVATLGDVKGVVRVYAWRWAIETAFETMKAWGLGRFMVRSWQAIDRLLWLVAVAYALLVVAVRDGPLTLLREQAAALLKRLAVLGRRLTVGKLAEAIGLDYHRHRRAWATCWLTCT